MRQAALFFSITGSIKIARTIEPVIREYRKSNGVSSTPDLIHAFGFTHYGPTANCEPG